jgi:hypothetical protein
MAEVVPHPSAPAESPEPEPVIEEAELLDAEGLAFETRRLVRMLDEEIGRRWMSLELRLQLEEIEIILGLRGFGA